MSEQRLIDAYDVRNALWELAEEFFAGEPDNYKFNAMLETIDCAPTIEPTTPKWTSVKDGLPEKKNEYEVRTWILVAMESGCVKEVRYEFYEGEKVFERMGSAVTHWMPLPEPPKGE